MSAPEADVPQVITLPNGLTLINVHMPSTALVKVQMMVKAGSRDETPQTAGSFHLDEHLFFDGTDRRPRASMLSDAIAATGGSDNAYTNAERVTYYAIGPARRLALLADVITDMLCHARFASSEVERERGPVLEELAMRRQMLGTWLWDTRFEVAYGGDQGLGWSPIGYTTLVQKVSREDLLASRRAFYTSDNMALVVVGGAVLDPADALRLTADLPRGTRPPRPPAVWGQGPPFLGKSVPASGQSQQVMANFYLQGFAAGDPDSLVADLLSTVMSGGGSSRLDAVIRAHPGSASSLYVDHTARDDTGELALSVVTTPKAQTQATRLMFSVLERLSSEAAGADELQKAKNILTGDLLRETEGAMGLGEYYAVRWSAGLPLITPAQLCEQIQAIDAAALQRVATRLFAGVKDVRFNYTHPAGVDGRNSVGQTNQEQGQALRAVALEFAREAHRPGRAGLSEVA